MSDHDFCRTLLRDARQEAKTAGVEIPKRLTAITSDRKEFFVEMNGRPGEYVTADCAFHAKAKFIASLIDAKAVL
jgi:hypothetical protein